MHPYPGIWISSWLWSCVMPGHLVQELHVGTVVPPVLLLGIFQIVAGQMNGKPTSQQSQMTGEQQQGREGEIEKVT